MDMPRERGDDGQYTETAGGDDVLGVFDAVLGPVVTSADVAEELGFTRETARRKLNGLVDEQQLEKRKTAGRVVYWRTGEPDEPASQRTADTDERREADGGDAIHDAVEAVADGWDDPAER